MMTLVQNTAAHLLGNFLFVSYKDINTQTDNESEYNRVQLCEKGLVQMFGFVPSKIKLANKNPKKKGWKKLSYLAGEVNKIYLAFEATEYAVVRPIIPDRYSDTPIIFYVLGVK